MFTLHNTWITSDLHLGHENVIRFDKRPFSGLEEMHAEIYKNFAKSLRKEDHLIIAGDLSYTEEDTINFIEHLPTKNVHYVRGNHESNSTKNIEHVFKSVHDLLEIKVNGLKPPVVICHYPLEEWNKCYSGSWHLHGHRHGNVPDDPRRYRLDMSTNLWGYAPVQLKTIKDIFSKRNKDEQLNYWRSTDYHGTTPRKFGRPLRDS